MSDLVRSLSHIVPGPDQVKRIEALREAAILYARVLEQVTLPSRCQSLAKTHLEESVMWGIKSLCLESDPSKKVGP